MFCKSDLTRREAYCYVLWVSSSEFSETANTEQEVFKTVPGMLLGECPAPYTVIIPCLVLKNHEYLTQGSRK